MSQTLGEENELIPLSPGVEMMGFVGADRKGQGIDINSSF